MNQSTDESSETTSWAGFLESCPPGQERQVTDFSRARGSGAGGAPPGRDVCLPTLQLHCPSDHCGDLRFFNAISRNPTVGKSPTRFFIQYQCKNCGESTKLYAIVAFPSEGQADASAIVYKLGEMPSYGPPVPPKVLQMAGSDRELFLRGRRAENQGLGIGAYAYYRRVVENQKDRLVSEIADVAEMEGADESTVSQIRSAKGDFRFGRAVEKVGDAIPETLYIEGHNPLVLLNNALSAGLHDGTEEQCLQLAGDVRVVLTELASRLGELVENQQELKGAVGRLMNDELVSGD